MHAHRGRNPAEIWVAHNHENTLPTDEQVNTIENSYTLLSLVLPLAQGLRRLSDLTEEYWSEQTEFAGPEPYPG